MIYIIIALCISVCVCVCVCVCVSVCPYFLHGAFRLVGNRPTGTRSSAEPSKETFRLVGIRLGGNQQIGMRSSSEPSKKPSDWSESDRSGRMKRLDWSGTDQSRR